MKPSEMDGIARMMSDLYELYEPAGLDRRRFLGQLGVAVLAVQCLPLNAFAQGHWPANGSGAADDLLIRSSPGAFSHAHDLLIPKAVIQAPPRAGVRLTSSKALYHRHVITLTENELLVVNHGGTIIQKASSHAFVIALARQQRT